MIVTIEEQGQEQEQEKDQDQTMCRPVRTHLGKSFCQLSIHRMVLHAENAPRRMEINQDIRVAIFNSCTVRWGIQFYDVITEES